MLRLDSGRVDQFPRHDPQSTDVQSCQMQLSKTLVNRYMSMLIYCNGPQKSKFQVNAAVLQKKSF